jgi:hypothetical protein
MAEREDWNERGSRNRLFWGITLITLGVISGLDYLHALPWSLGETTWPFIVIVIGVVQAATAYSAKKLGSGISLALMGGWFWVAVNHWHGFSWTNSWPLALVASGVGMVVHSLAVPFYRRRETERVESADVR